MEPTAVTAITDFLLAGEVLFLAGMVVQWPKERFSPAWFWSGVMLLMGVAALLGGIDHGIFEPGRIPRHGVQRSTWIALAAMTLCLLMTTVTQFLRPALHRIFLVVGVAQFAVDTVAALRIDDFLVVILNYAPVMLWLLVMNLLGLRSGSGSPALIAGIVVSFAASGIQAAGVDVFSPLDHNGLYHVLSMIGVVFLYLGGKRLRPTASPRAGPAIDSHTCARGMK